MLGLGLVATFACSTAVAELELAFEANIGGPKIDVGRSIAVDTAGNIYTTGHFSGAVDFDPGFGTFSLQSSFPGTRSLTPNQN